MISCISCTKYLFSSMSYKKVLTSLFKVHIQTIGILVAEKTELQSQLSQSQKIAAQRLCKYIMKKISSISS